jgi:outer membrane beta-barrel protein
MLRILATTLALLLCALPAYGQDDDLDDILGGTFDPPPTDERSLENVEAEDEAKKTAPPPRRRVIKVLQKKNFMKLQRFEITPLTSFGFVTNDPFINRFFVGNVAAAYHVTEIFAVELSGSFAPDLGEFDWKPVTKQIVNENQVTPDISKIIVNAAAAFQFSPIYGKIAVLGKNIVMFDIFGTFGTGIANTQDDLEALQNAASPLAQATQSQAHPTLIFGGGLRVSLTPNVAVKLEGRGMSYIEVLESTTLEMKNNVILQSSVSFFLPGMKK